MTQEDLVQVAAASPAVTRIQAFVDWVGAGRALTQTGLLRRAEALALVDLLETGDVLDERFPVRSSGELYHLMVLVEWAKAAGLVRIVRGRIIGVKKNAKLLERPSELVSCLLSALPGVLSEIGHSVVAVDAVHTVEAVFADVVGEGGAGSPGRACEVAWATAMRRYELPGATEVQMSFARAQADGDIGRMLETVADLGLLTLVDGVITLTPLGTRTVGEWLGLGTPDSELLTVRVSLQKSADPEVWRVLRVPSDVRLDRFHQTLGASMGWEDSHLHVFERGPERYGFPDPELDIRDDRDTTLGALLKQPGDRLLYEYDFGDSWEHDVALEAVTPSDGRGARCIGGEGRCPPEDVGGIHGYANLRQVLASPGRTGHREVLDWLGLDRAADFSPAAFSVEDANHAITRMLSAVWI
jgi:hypothetical protein